MKQNTRGSRNPTAAVVAVPNPSLVVPKVIGSQSYNWATPIVTLPGRGLPLNLTLYYNSRVWTVDAVNGLVAFNLDRDFPSPGFRLDFGFLELDSTNRQYVVNQADGSKHALPLTTTNIYDSDDGTFMEYNSQTSVLTYKNGLMVSYQPFPSQAKLFRPIKIEDTNGNYISISYRSGTGNDQHIDIITDTLGRPFQFHYDPVSNQLQEIDQLNTSRTAVLRVWAIFVWGAPVLKYQFSFPVQSTIATGSPMPALIACRYPNNTGYNFSYGDWGIINRIDSVSAPDTSQVQHVRSYEAYNFPDASQILSDAPRYTTKTVSRDGATNTGSISTWTYGIIEPSLGNVTQETISDILGTTTTFNLNPDGTLSSTILKDGSGKTLKTTVMNWTPVGSSSMLAGVTTQDDVGNAGSVSLTYDSSGNITDAKQYDFSHSLVRETVTTYLSPTNLHVLDRPTSVKVLDGAGVVRSRTDYDYDTNAITPISNLVQNDIHNYGNVTQISSYLDPATPAGQNYVKLFYDQAGNLIKEQPNCCPPGGNIVPNASTLTLFNFDPATQYAYLSSVTKGGQYTTNFNFSPDNGLLQWSKDLNNQQTFYQYDDMFRITGVTSPPSNGQAVQQIISYTDNSQAPQVTATSTVNSSKIVQTFDGLGHLTQQDTVDTSGASSPATVSTTQFQYDSIWRRIKTSNPFAGSESVLWNTTAYDALNRVTSVTPPSGGGTTFNYAGNTVLITDPANKQRKNFFDSLGRLIRVDEPGWGDALDAIDSVVISGTERSKLVSTRYCAQYTFSNPPRCVDWEFDTSTDYDTGNVTATINGVAYSAPYGQNDSPATVATTLAGKINADPNRIVNASASGSTVNFFAVMPGVSGNNITVSSSSATSNPGEFGTGTTSFPASTQTPTLTGGESAVSQANAVLTATRHLTTTYGYDVLNHLVTVSQGAMGPVNGQTFPGQPRNFVYDALGRLTSSTTPESGTVNNYYTDVNQSACSGDIIAVCRTTDARGITATFTYNDPLNRLTGISYSDSTSPVTYTYDTGGQGAFAFGRLTRIVEDVAGASNPNAQTFAYDNRGRVTSVVNTIAGQNYPLQYAYNSADQTTSLTYPSGRILNFSYDNIGRLNTVADSSNPASPYLKINSSDYSSAGLFKKLAYGNGVSAALNYNDHLQMSSLSYSTPAAPPAAPDILNLSYDYGAANNAQISTIHYFSAAGTEDTTRSIAYLYDPWLRLIQAQTLNQTSGASWMLQWTYDRFGNRLSQGGTGNGIISQPNLTFDSASNHIIGYCYDSAGNLTDEAGCPPSGSPHRYTYDAAGRLTGVNNGSAVATYTYFGALRIQKTAGTTNTVYVYSNGAPLAEYAPGALANNPSREYIYGGLGMLASISSGAITYFHPDHLSNRAETSATGTTTRTLGTFPFGDAWYDSNPAEKWKFTSYERDSATGETGLDYAVARSYESGLARFTSPDPMFGSLAAPQSLNRYSYVTNDPINFTDPTGLKKEKICMLLDNGDASNFCVGLENFLDPAFGEGDGSGADFMGSPLTYVPGLGFIFTNSGFSLDLGGLSGGSMVNCFVEGGCPSIPFLTLGQELNNFMARMPWNNPCLLSPISDGCDFDNLLPDTSPVANFSNCMNAVDQQVQDRLAQFDANVTPRILKRMRRGAVIGAVRGAYGGSAEGPAGTAVGAIGGGVAGAGAAVLNSIVIEPAQRFLLRKWTELTATAGCVAGFGLDMGK